MKIDFASYIKIAQQESGESEYANAPSSRYAHITYTNPTYSAICAFIHTVARGMGSATRASRGQPRFALATTI